MAIDDTGIDHGSDGAVFQGSSSEAFPHHGVVGGASVGLFITVSAIVGSSNAVNLTDGLDGLAIGCTLIVSFVFYIFTYIAGNAEIASELYVPMCAERRVIGHLCGMIGADWVPVVQLSSGQGVHGRHGVAGVGGSLGIMAVLIHQPFVLVIAGGVFVLEALSVMLQRGWFKWTRLRTGEGRRIFSMAPLHHHFQKRAGTKTRW